jgi:thioredoxin reductase (NADPH)
MVIGGGDTAMEDALVLARTSASVVVVHRGESFRASKILQDRVLSHPKISVAWNSKVEAFEGDHSLEQVAIKDVNSGVASKVRVAGAFVAIGHDPATSVFMGRLDADKDGYLQVRYPTTATSVAGVFAAGDVSDKIYRQAVTSAGSGAMAALDAERWISAGQPEQSPEH